MISRALCVLFASLSIAAGKPGGKGTDALTGKGPLNADTALALAQQLLPKVDAAAGRDIRVVASVEGKFVSLTDNKVTTLGPALALMVNVTEKKADLGVVHWMPHIFVMKSRGDEIELVSHLEPLDLAHDLDVAVDKGSKLSLTTLPLSKEANGIVATLRKAEGNDAGGNIEEIMVLYLVQRDGMAIAFSVKPEVTSSEKVDGVMQTNKEINKVETGKKGGKLVDLMVTTRKYEIKGDETDEYKPTTERWCWNDKATSYLPECK